jgi:methionyl-tRNA formyltransferase
MIYHFCDDSFGPPFELRTIAFAKQRRVPVTIVRAAARSRSLRSRLSSAARRTAERWDGSAIRRFEVEDVNAPTFLDRIGPDDHGIVTGFNQIFAAELIARFGSLVNLHPSLLPYYRGPEPTAWCILNGESQTGFTIHQITSRIDDGPILYQEVVPIEKNADATSLAHAIALQAAPVFARYLEFAASGGEWTRITVDAAAIYRSPVGYRSAVSSKSRTSVPT